MEYSFWTDTRGYTSVSRSKNLPGPVVGYLIPGEEETWIIEGDESGAVYQSREQAAKVLLEISN